MKVFCLLIISLFILPCSNGSAAPSVERSYSYLLGGYHDYCVYQFSEGPKGRLTLLGPSSVGTVGQPCAAVASVDGRFLYVDTYGATSISTFAVADDGRLHLLRSGTIEAPLADALAVSPDGKFLYDMQSDGAVITAFNIGRDGRLRRLPFVIKTDPLPLNMAFDTTGRFAYVLCQRSVDPPSGTRLIDQFRVNENGSLAPVDTRFFLECGGFAAYIFSRPGYPFVYVPSDVGITQYQLPAHGEFVRYKQPDGPQSIPQAFAALDEPYKLIIGTARADPRLGGYPCYLMVTALNQDNTLTNITAYSVSKFGVLKRISLDEPSGPPLSADLESALVTLAVDPDRQILYAFDEKSYKIFRFLISSDGTLSELFPSGDTNHPPARVNTPTVSWPSDYGSFALPYLFVVNKK